MSDDTHKYIARIWANYGDLKKCIEILEARDAATLARAERAEAALAEAVAENERLRYGLECVYQYGSDTLVGPSQGAPDDRKWQRDGVLIMTRRARSTLEGDSAEEIVSIRADFAVPGVKINWSSDPDAIVEDDGPQIGRDYA